VQAADERVHRSEEKGLNRQQHTCDEMKVLFIFLNSTQLCLTGYEQIDAVEEVVDCCLVTKNHFGRCRCLLSQHR
jgi:hypothetical protein